MALGVTWLLRNATTTNTIGHSFVHTGSEGAYGDFRYFNLHDTTGWDGTTETNYQGVTADGTIARTDTILYGNPPIQES